MRGTPTTPHQHVHKNSKYLQQFTFKPYVFPNGFILKVDTREQNSPLFSKPPKGLLIIRDTLKNGDYSFVGGEDRFCIEKKYHSDLYSYCTTEWKDKTTSKLEKMRNMISSGGWCGLLIDERESDIFKWQEHTMTNPESVRGALNAIRIRYGVHVYFAPTKEHSVRFILDSAIKFYNIQKEL
jgi:ERCC4-type nuclease